MKSYTGFGGGIVFVSLVKLADYFGAMVFPCSTLPNSPDRGLVSLFTKSAACSAMIRCTPSPFPKTRDSQCLPAEAVAGGKQGRGAGEMRRGAEQGEDCALPSEKKM